MHVNGVGRTDERVMREARALVRAGYEVTLVDVEKDAARPHQEDIDGVHLRHVLLPSRYKASRVKAMFFVKMWRSSRAVARELGKVPADIYHAHDFNALYPTHKAARQRRKPLVYDAHELPLVDPEVTRFTMIHRFAVRSLKRILSHCDSMITVSAPIVDELRMRYGGPPAVLVRNIPSFHEPISSNRLREALRLPESTRVAVYQGGFQPNRSLDVLVRAAPYLDPGHVIVMVGGGQSKPGIERLIAELGVGDRVILHPSVPYQELLEWTASADLGLILYRGSYSPNVLHCLPNKIFEYLMAGVPVLSSPLDAIEEIIRTYGVGRVAASTEPEVVGRAISLTLSDEEGLSYMRRNALVAARRELNWEVEQQRLVDLYDRHFQPSRVGAVPLRVER